MTKARKMKAAFALACVAVFAVPLSLQAVAPLRAVGVDFTPQTAAPCSGTRACVFIDSTAGNILKLRKPDGSVNAVGGAGFAGAYTGALTAADNVVTLDATRGPLVLTQSTAPNIFTANGGALTGQTASVEINDIYFNLNRIVQRAAGAVATQRTIRIAAPTYSFVSSSAITDAATVAISGPPTIGTNWTGTPRLAALWLEAGALRMGAGGSSTAPSIYFGTETNTGIYSTSGLVGFTVQGTQVATFYTNSTIPQFTVGNLLVTPTSIIAGSTNTLTVKGLASAGSTGTDLSIGGNQGSRTSGHILKVQDGGNDLMSIAWHGGTTHTMRAATGLTTTTPFFSVPGQTWSFNVALTDQKFTFIGRPSIAFDIARTAVRPSTVFIDGMPTSGTNATLVERAALTISHAMTGGLGPSSGYGIALRNPAAADAGTTRQFSPSLMFDSSAWDTTAVTVVQSKWMVVSTPTSGSAVAGQLERLVGHRRDRWQRRKSKRLSGVQAESDNAEWLEIK
jgi:hypothetical protein